MSDNVKIGKFMSFVLRHNPESIGVQLDENGWADVDELIVGMNKAGYNVDFLKIEEIVETNNKQRYSFNADKSKIRANQGHSINVDVELKESKPPKILYHGTADKYLKNIMQSGLQKQNRLYLHLSADKETATKVGKRHGNPVILIIEAQEMFEKGYKFYLSKNGVWLTDNVPVEFISLSL